MICPPLGHEYVVSHRALRLLAERSSRSGRPALRIDYYGTGDAPGRIEAATLPVWIHGTGLALDVVKRRTRSRTASLIGLRVGGTIALASGLQRGDIGSLVLWDPVLDGQSYLAELRRRHEDWARAYEVNHWKSPPTGENHVLGYPISPSLRKSVEAVQAGELQRAPAFRVLLVLSRLEPSAERLVESLKKLDVSVDLLTSPEAAVWNQSVDVVVPAAPTGVLSEILAWLADAPGIPTPGRSPSLESPPHASGSPAARRAEAVGTSDRFAGDEIVEHAVSFGEPPRLVGILTGATTDATDTSASSPAPVPRHASSRSPAILFLNAGLLHRVGPKRLWVRAARRLARGGRTVFRFDFSGVGDSPPRRDGVPFHDSRVVETRAAMDLVAAETGHQRFVLIGLCTGADYGFRTALVDPRVVGVLLLDGYPYRTLGWYARHYGRRLLRPRSWSRLLSGKYSFGRELIRRLRPTVAPKLGDELSRQIPPRREMAAHLRGLVNRGTSLHFLYTGGMPAWYNYAGQFEAAFGRFGESLKVTFLGEADHLFTPPGCQEELLERVERWLDERYGTGEARRSAAFTAGA
ncbi:MAG: alpha/beta fold hydrolase [Gemmatimonadota bacterium]